jgi:choline monooxygenase
MVTPMPGLGPDDKRVWRYAFIYPNTTIDLYPDQVNTWQMLPDGVGSTSDTWGSYRAPGADPRTRLVQWANQRLNTLVFDEDIDLVDNVQQGLQTRGYRCGPLGAREAGVAWFADRVRADLAPALQ